MTERELVEQANRLLTSESWKFHPARRDPNMEFLDDPEGRSLWGRVWDEFGPDAWYGVSR